MFEIIKWSELLELVKINFHIELRKMNFTPDAFSKDEVEVLWYDNYEELENIEILERLEDLRKFEGQLYIVTDESYEDEFGPFKVNASDIYEFVANYWGSFGKIGGYFVNTDLMIFNFELKLIWIAHHEGAYYILDFSK